MHTYRQGRSFSILGISQRHTERSRNRCWFEGSTTASGVSEGARAKSKPSGRRGTSVSVLRYFCLDPHLELVAIRGYTNRRISPLSVHPPELYPVLQHAGGVRSVDGFAKLGRLERRRNGKCSTLRYCIRGSRFCSVVPNEPSPVPLGRSWNTACSTKPRPTTQPKAIQAQLLRGAAATGRGRRRCPRRAIVAPAGIALSVAFAIVSYV